MNTFTFNMTNIKRNFYLFGSALLFFNIAPSGAFAIQGTERPLLFCDLNSMNSNDHRICTTLKERATSYGTWNAVPAEVIGEIRSFASRHTDWSLFGPRATYADFSSYVRNVHPTYSVAEQNRARVASLETSTNCENFRYPVVRRYCSAKGIRDNTEAEVLAMIKNDREMDAHMTRSAHCLALARTYVESVSQMNLCAGSRIENCTVQISVPPRTPTVGPASRRRGSGARVNQDRIARFTSQAASNPNYTGLMGLERIGESPAARRHQRFGEGSNGTPLGVLGKCVEDGYLSNDIANVSSFWTPEGASGFSLYESCVNNVSLASCNAFCSGDIFQGTSGICQRVSDASALVPVYAVTEDFCMRNTRSATCTRSSAGGSSAGAAASSAKE